MRTYEQAAVRVAIKRSQRANNNQEGYKYINDWYNKHKNDLIIDIDTVRKEYATWVDSQYIV